MGGKDRLSGVVICGMLAAAFTGSTSGAGCCCGCDRGSGWQTTAGQLLSARQCGLASFPDLGQCGTKQRSCSPPLRFAGFLIAQAADILRNQQTLQPYT